MSDNKTYKYKYVLEIEAPLQFKNGIPAHIQLEFFSKSLPYILAQALGGEAKVTLKELPEKS